MEDGHGLFETEEVADQELGKVNIACGENPEFLFAPGDLHDAFLAAKGSGAVFFAAIVGVPYQGGGATACQGPGDGLDDCLDQDAMQLVPEELEGVWSYAPACSRSEDATEVTRGYPGRRYVELAHSGFGSRSYVYSICNPDWTAAFSDIAAAIDPLLAW